MAIHGGHTVVGTAMIEMEKNYIILSESKRYMI